MPVSAAQHLKWSPTFRAQFNQKVVKIAFNCLKLTTMSPTDLSVLLGTKFE